jgi:hypothetical protein
MGLVYEVSVLNSNICYCSRCMFVILCLLFFVLLFFAFTDFFGVSITPFVTLTNFLLLVVQLTAKFRSDNRSFRFTLSMITMVINLADYISSDQKQRKQ